MRQDIPPFRNGLRSGCSSLSYRDYHSFAHLPIHHLAAALFLLEVRSCQDLGLYFSGTGVYVPLYRILGCMSDYTLPAWLALAWGPHLGTQVLIWGLELSCMLPPQ